MQGSSIDDNEKQREANQYETGGSDYDLPQDENIPRKRALGQAQVGKTAVRAYLGVSRISVEPAAKPYVVASAATAAEKRPAFGQVLAASTVPHLKKGLTLNFCRPVPDRREKPLPHHFFKSGKPEDPVCA
jgi:hypothetical protein